MLAGLTGVAVGVGGLTRYAFVWLIVPVLLFVLLFGGKQRVMAALVALFTFAVVMAPWVVRNYSVERHALRHGGVLGPGEYHALSRASPANARWSRT